MRVELCEHGVVERVPLPRQLASRIGAVVPGLQVSPSQDEPGSYDLAASSWVGSISIGELTLDITPKMPVDRLLFLISYSLDPANWRKETVDLAGADGLTDATLVFYLGALRRLLRRGLLQGYRTEDDALATVRGRVRWDDQLRRWYGRTPPIEVRYDDFTEDTELNRLLKSALRKLMRSPLRSRELRSEARAVDSAFQRVGSVEIDRRSLPNPIFDRLNRHYRPAVDLARLILCDGAVDHRAGPLPMNGFLVDMNVVFEAFVVTALREALGADESAFPRCCSGRDLCLDNARTVRLEPDLSWWHHGRCTFVGDVKYKRVRSTSYPNADIYQMLAYLIATGLGRGLLIYPAGEAEETSVEVGKAEKTIEFATLDLSREPDALLIEVSKLADRVRSIDSRS